MLQLVILSGRSGSGKSTALDQLEDAGFYCVDNIPIQLLPFLPDALKGKYSRIALNLDIRNISDWQQDLSNIITQLKSVADVVVVYMDSSNQSLLKRYSETRRVHPLSLMQAGLSLEEAIVEEGDLLRPIREMSDLFIDTSELSIHDLNKIITNKVLNKKAGHLRLVFQSFGFKFGIPTDADYVFDARFLPNPHWDENLRPLTGLDRPVQEFLKQHDEVQAFIDKISSCIEDWLPMLEQNNRSYVTVAIGCTGGKHRSVYVTESLGWYFASRHSDVAIVHREQNKHDK
ncbi:glmZ(sRNA)-inactivating NTPase [Catenovulum agarivorans DS-2]|uniref:GlmZ(SRNA)-inactivating NTPase n=1 Tax=Catenovulum agarivorans DS-2 TaxID=1328313 RepID=W7QV15_9ALTE|nr:RNase adapter RapZ [Catenovulum agarivorans]EWH09125.1 glmZ(sRNA)-inactivating NTPase [Catenovulum agarivorans DS-2]